MPHYKYLIIGGGMTADAAARGILEADSSGGIGLLSAEKHPPYDRPPLSKGLWKGKPEAKIWRGTNDIAATLHLGRSAQTLDAREKKVTDDQGETYTYEKLLLATGASPRRLPFGQEMTIYFRTFDDYQQLRGLTQKGERFAVIGGGFIGSEIAAALAMNGKKVSMVFPEAGVGANMFPLDLARFLTELYREKGVEVITGGKVARIDRAGDKTAVYVDGDKKLEVDGTIAGLGVEPNVALAKMAGLKVDNGIVVDEFLRTTDANIYAAGDVANFYNPALDTRMRVEHEDNANTMGETAGRSMAGKGEPYHHLPLFYSDLFEMGYEAVGELNSRLETFADWSEPYRNGVVYYLNQGRLRGVLLWNVWEKVDEARALLAEKRPIRAADLKGRITA